MKISFLRGNKSCSKRYFNLFISLDFLGALKKGRSVRNSGQVTVEYILLAVTLLVLFQVASNTFTENDFLKNFQETPQKIFTNMVENGNWIVDTTESRANHPNHWAFHYSSEGEGP